MEEDSKGTDLGNVIRIDDERVRDHLGRIVRGTVEETLNAMLEAEADRLCNAERYERTQARRDQRSGSYERKLQTKAGQVTLKVPKLRVQTFETAIIERYRRRESSVEEALIEMYLAGVSVRRVEDITEALWGTRVSPGTVSNLNKKIYGQIRPGGTGRSTASSRMSISTASCSSAHGRARCATCRFARGNPRAVVAISVNADGYRQILGIVEGAKEDKAGWSGFLAHLKGRGLRGVELIVSDACMGLVESAAEFFPEARWQRCMVHFYRNVFSHVPAGKLREVALMLKAIHAQEDLAAAQRKAAEVTARLHSMRLGKAAESAPSAAPWSRRRCPRPWRTTRSPRSTGGASGLTIRSSASCARSAGARVWSAPSPTATRPSTLLRRD